MNVNALCRVVLMIVKLLLRYCGWYGKYYIVFGSDGKSALCFRPGRLKIKVIYCAAFAQLLAAAGCGDSGNYPDERVAMHRACTNNLIQIGIGFRIWAGDNRGQKPFDVSTNEGGVKELVSVKNGLRQNAYEMFRCMSNELTVPHHQLLSNFRRCC